MQKVIVVITKGADDFGAYAENVPYIFGRGDTIQETKESIEEAIELFKEHNKEVPEILKGEYEFEYILDVE